MNEQIKDKIAHIITATQSRYHTCHWPGCDKQITPAMWGCRKHWYMLPSSIRNRIWNTYQIGQEETLDVSENYLEAAKAAQNWIAKFLKFSGKTNA